LTSFFLRLVRREDVSATWSGIRPLVTDPDAKDTAAIVRDHFIESRPSNLITITGGKWTTYRTMAQELVDKAIEVGKLSAGKCVTDKVPILGAGGWDKSLFLNVAQNYYRSKQPNHGKYSRSPFNKDIAEHLSNSYGTRALLVAELAQQGFGKRLAHNQPYIEAEVVYAARYEYACTAVDLIARRLRLAFLDSAAAHQALPRTVSIMAQELGWDAERQKQETEQALAFLNTMN
jgi:glycerol-3-phosphate dehydrogenase